MFLPVSPVVLFLSSPSEPTVSNFSDGIKRGRNVTGASYGAGTNDGVVTDLRMPLLVGCSSLQRHREQIHGDIPSATTTTETPDSPVIERSLFV